MAAGGKWFGLNAAFISQKPCNVMPTQKLWLPHQEEAHECLPTAARILDKAFNVKVLLYTT